MDSGTDLISRAQNRSGMTRPILTPPLGYTVWFPIISSDFNDYSSPARWVQDGLNRHYNLLQLGVDICSYRDLGLDPRTGADPGGNPLAFSGTPKLQKEGKMLHACTGMRLVLVLNLNS